MATEKIGVEAVFETKQFKANAEQYERTLDQTTHATENQVKANQRLAKENSGLFKTFTDIKSGIDTARMAFGYLKAAGDETIGFYMEYATQTRDFIRNTGMSAEAAQTLMEAAGTVGVSFESLSTALKMYIKNGGDPSLQSILGLSDAYKQLAPGAERARFLLDKFGKAGLDMGRIMEMTSGQILSMRDDLQSTGKMLDDEGIAKAKEYALAMDDVGDVIEGLKVRIGVSLVGVLTKAMPFIKAFFMLFGKGLDTLQMILDFLPRFSAAVEQQNNTLLASSSSFEEYKAGINAMLEPYGLWIDDMGYIRQGMLGFYMTDAPAFTQAAYDMEKGLLTAEGAMKVVEVEIPAFTAMMDILRQGLASKPVQTFFDAIVQSAAEAKRSTDGVVTSLQNLTVASIGAQVIGTLGQLMKDHKITSEQYSEAMMNVGTQMLGMSPAMIIMNTDLASIDTRVKDGSLSFDYYLGRIGAIGGQVSVIQTAAEKQDLLQKAEDANWRTRKDLLAQADTLLPQEFNLTTEVGNQFTGFENLHGSVGTTTTKMALLGGSVKLVTEQQFIPARDVISDLKKKLEDLPRRIQIKLNITIEGDGKGLIKPPPPLTPPPRGNRAAGGPVYPGQTYVVGEQRPEVLVMGRGGGFVYPSISNFNSQAVSNNTNTKNVSINVKSSQPVLRSAINALDVLRVLA